MKAKSFGLRRGMLVQLDDGSIEKVEHIFRMPAKYQKKGALMFQSSKWLWHSVNDVKILGFENKERT